MGDQCASTKLWLLVRVDARRETVCLHAPDLIAALMRPTDGSPKDAYDCLLRCGCHQDRAPRRLALATRVNNGARRADSGLMRAPS